MKPAVTNCAGCVMSERGVFACEITQNNMWPRHAAGNVVLFEVNELPHIGDDVFVRMIDGSVMLWRLDALSDDELTVTSYNPATTETISRSRIQAMHPVLFSLRPDDAERLYGIPIRSSNEVNHA